MLRFRDYSIRRKLFLLTTLSSAVGLLLAAVALIGYAWFAALSGFERDLATVSQIVAQNSSAALVFRDRVAAQDTLAALHAKPEITHACLYLRNGDGSETLIGSYAAEGESRCPPQSGSIGLERQAKTVTIITPVELKGARVGTLSMTQTLAPLLTGVRTQVIITLVVFAVSFAVSFLVGWWIQRGIAKPITALAETAQRVSETQDYDLRALYEARDEVGQLVVHFNQMLTQIALRRAQLQTAREDLQLQVEEKTTANTELRRVLERLQEAQAQLVQSEKLASLGGLVAGVAHEINTPVGVGVTAASALEASTQQLRRQYESDNMRRSDLERFIATAAESTGIILHNLQRAADLIQSFKQVAVDQSSGERRCFQLKHYLEEVLLSLQPQIRKHGHSATVECPSELSIDSYPGALAQIVTNLVSNSLAHGYSSDQHGNLRVVVREVGDHIELVYSDDGCGIPPEHMGKVFDPFFTTKRGRGGSGLGLHIVFNLVVQLLHGKVWLDSRPGEGTSVTVQFPKNRTMEVAPA